MQPDQIRRLPLMIRPARPTLAEVPLADLSLTPTLYLRGYEEFRGDLVLLYFPTIDRSTGRLVELRMVPLQIHRFSLRQPPIADAAWLVDTLARISRLLGTEVAYAGGGLCVSLAGRGC
jgi:hypothetical protein